MKKILRVEKIVHNGYGLSRENNKTYFIPYKIENEEVEIKIIKEKKNYSYAFPEKVLSPSKHRVRPECSYFQSCGGCDFQHIDYSHQITVKKNVINEFIQKADIFPEQEVNFIPSPEPFAYRINTKLRIQSNRFGFLKKHSNKIILIDRCPLLDENINKFIRSVKDYHSIKSLIIKIDNNKNISSNIKKNRLQFSVDDLNIYYDFRVFFQANKFLIKKWLEIIAGFISPFNKKRIIEFYCGTGIISLYLAAKFDIKKITGIDIDNTAINFARLSREKNRLFNIKFISGRAEKAVKEFSAANVVIIDPPRGGVSGEVLDKILKLQPQAIVYLSCEISTFIRDAGEIIEKGYTFQNLCALDMFPQTYHFETIGLFVLG